jgi:hypothetical protein
VWAQDFPLKSKSSNSEFEETLASFLQSLSAETMATLIKNYDFAEAKVKLITSVPGVHKQKEYGHMRLGSLVSAWDFPKEKSILDYQVTCIALPQISYPS